jgi:hypothetical protein
MRPLSAPQLLALWDAGKARHPIDRALLALAMAMPDETPAELADRPVGWRERNLLALRNATFGSALDGYAACPACGALMEFALDGNLLVNELPAPDEDARIVIDHQQWRVPSSRDQAAILDAADPEEAVLRLLTLCRIDESPPLWPVAVDSQKGPKTEISPALADELEARMEQLDPAANIRLAMRCRDCGHTWDAFLDVAACFWSELAAHARQLLETVHRLASAYGWREADILSLSPARRAAYLSMVD